MKYLVIEYANPRTLADSLRVRFKLLENDLVPLWVQAVCDAQNAGVPIDDPTRFYGFYSKQQEVATAITSINQCVDTINNYSHLIDRTLSNIDDQDTLNYLHHIFEIYHGLLDQPHEFFLTAPPEVKKSLSDLNILVHRCESISRGSPPRHVVTYFGLPKNRLLADNHYELLTNEHEFGTVFINYAEIGKTLSELMTDNDDYISPDAFKPVKHYSADFVVRYWNTNPLAIQEKNAKIQAYHKRHYDFFGEWQSCYADGNIPVAVIDQSLDIKDLVSRQYVKSVTFE